MAEVLGLASGIAGLLSLAIEVTKLSYRYIHDVRSAKSTQKQYLREIAALTEVLLRIEEAAQTIEAQGTPATLLLTNDAIRGCESELQQLRAQLEKPLPGLLWPFKDKAITSHIEELHRFRSIFSSSLSTQTLITVSATQREVARLGQHQDLRELLDWIGKPNDPSAIDRTPLEGTGKWFLESEEYSYWRTSSDGRQSRQFWCHGPPGVGKSMVAKVALQDLQSRLKDDESVCVVDYFCEFSNRKRQKKESIWRDVLFRIAAQNRPAVTETLVRCRSKSSSTRYAKNDELAEALYEVCRSVDVVIVMDGPDELESPKDLGPILDPFIKSHSRIFISSRDLPEIRDALHPLRTLQMEQTDENDLRAYLSCQFEQNDMDDLLDDHPDLATEIIEKSNGIFLLGEILINELLQSNTVKEMRRALKSSPTHLDQAFEVTLKRIDSQSKSRSSLAHRVLGWVACAERNLSVSELLHGLVTEEGEDEIDMENFVSVKTILKVCGGLVMASARDGKVAMVHSTIHEWFRNREGFKWHEDIARSSLRYLTLKVFSAGLAASADELEARMKELPFLQYAAQNWRSHILNDEVLNDLTSAIDVFLGNTNSCSAAFQVSNFQGQLKDLAVRSATFDTIPTGHIALHFAAYWNLGDKACQLIDSGQPLDARDSQNWTSLHWACFSRSQQTVRVLFLRGADTMAKDSVGWTPLFWAALQGDTNSLELLLQHESDHMVQDVHGWTVLRWAAARRQTKVIEMLVNHYRQMQSQDCQPSTSNDIESQTTTNDAVDVVRRDLIKGLRDGTKHLQDQPGSDFVELYHVFFDKKPDMEKFWSSDYFDPPVGNAWRTMSKLKRMFHPSRDISKAAFRFQRRGYLGDERRGWSLGLIHAAVRGRDLVAVKLLLELGVDINGDELRTPLHTAMFHTDSAIAKLLLENGADIEAHDYEHITPLQQAVINGFVEPTRLLLSMGADVNAAHTFEPENHRGRNSPAFRTPLMLACGLRRSKEVCLEMVQLLLDHGANVHINDKDKGPAGMPVLHYAASSHCPDLLDAVIKAGADIMATDNYGRTSLHHLALGYRQHEAVYDLRYQAACYSLPSYATSCFRILLSKGGCEQMNKIAKWKHEFPINLKSEEYSQAGYYFRQEGIYSPLALSLVEKDKELFDELRRVSAEFETDAPLVVCLSKAVEMMSSDAIELVLANGAAFPQRCINEFADLDNILLDHCAQSGNLEDLEKVLKVLIPHGLEMDREFPRYKGSEDRRTLLGWAVSNSSVGAVEVLIKMGANPFHEDVEHLDCFLIAFVKQKFDNLRFLLEFSATHPLANHWTQHLDHSKLTGDSDMLVGVCQALKKSGILIDIGKSLLSKASKSGHGLVVGALLRVGVDIEAGDGTTPIDAADHSHEDLLKGLLEFGLDALCPVLDLACNHVVS
ncbi:unnamed protein product [Clonostachys byssicola]|uniref:Uncharacterized protein n=1 Tax=Clonostachys byssicola TaxID=160290 RepID=A0A9N9XWU7_9HYPO|nr:unnamed protein product [Clonostachys byssicola]